MIDPSELNTRSEALRDEIVGHRRALHARPELAWKEIETSRYIEEKLRALGCVNVKRGFKGTGSGVVADIVGGAGPLVALRADIDALPLTEETGLPFASAVPGTMHACGHDGHAAMLLGAAKLLTEMKERLSGSVRLIFQPAEESGYDSGAEAMIAEGVLEGVAAIGGLHLWSPLPSGKLGWRRGACMASADIWKATVRGKGGHGSAPQETIDPTVAIAHIITMLQTIASRETDPRESVVVSIGRVEAGTAPNIIPESALLVGNVRTTSRRARETVEERIRGIIGGVSAALRCATTVQYDRVYPVNVNDDAALDALRAAAEAALGAENVEEMPIVMGSEDFSSYGEKVPSAFAMLGVGDAAKGTDRPHHSPRFDIDEDVLCRGAAVLAGFALTVMERAQR